MQEDHARRAPGGGLIESHVTTVWQALERMVLEMKGRAADRLCPLLLLVLFWTHPCNTGIIHHYVSLFSISPRCFGARRAFFTSLNPSPSKIFCDFALDVVLEILRQRGSVPTKILSVGSG